MNYNETLEFMFSQLPMYHRVGAAAYKADLKNTLAICDLLGNPQRTFPTIHIAGTNGKGSVSHMLASILQQSGLKTGLYTSPHLKDFRERIRVNGQMIGENEVVEFMETCKKGFESIKPSFFEMTVGMAFDHFRKSQVDIAVIEVGLGGRLDSTNIITPVMSVITNVSFDHMQLLGDTLEQIATEKAGIIKTGIPVVIGETQPAVRHVFIETAEMKRTRLTFADAHFRSRNVRQSKTPPFSLTLDIYKGTDLFMPRVVSPLSGNYQRKNIITVMQVCEKLNEKGIKPDEEAIRTGIAGVIQNTGLSGRWQLVDENPLTICDTGHNEAGLGEVLAQIAETPHKKLHFVFGVVNDKSITKILSMLPKEALYYFCKADIPRGLDAEELRQAAITAGLKGKTYPSVKEAYTAARKAAKKNDLVFVGGSTFIVAEIL